MKILFYILFGLLLIVTGLIALWRDGRKHGYKLGKFEILFTVIFVTVAIIGGYCLEHFCVGLLAYL